MVANGDRQRAEQGLHEALDRFEARVSDSTLGDPLVPFAEALNWAYSLEEWHEAQLRKAGVDYYAKRDNDPDGEVVAGVIYARGLVAHHLVKIGLVASLDRYYDDYGAYGNLVWRPFSELPPPDKPEKKGRDEKYKGRVQHKRLIVTMRAVERFLTVLSCPTTPDFADHATHGSALGTRLRLIMSRGAPFRGIHRVPYRPIYLHLHPSPTVGCPVRSLPVLEYWMVSWASPLASDRGGGIGEG